MAGEKPLVQGKRKCQPKCGEHLFNIIPRNTGRCWFKSETKIDFCPIYNETFARFENIVPIFNNDEQSCLPGFILELDKNDYQQSMKKYKEDHEKKIQEYTTKKKQLQIPKPGRKHRYCGVCRKQYTDYLDVKISDNNQHIQSNDHIRSFNQHDFVNVINRIVNEDYRKKTSEASNNDSSTYPSRAILQDAPKKRGRKPKIQTEPQPPKKISKKKQQQQQQQQEQQQQQQQQQQQVQTPPDLIPHQYFTQKPPMFFYPYFPIQHLFYPYPPPPPQPMLEDRGPYKQVKQSEINVEDMIGEIRQVNNGDDHD